MPDQEHKKHIDGKLYEIKDCPECDGKGVEKCTCQCGNEHENICYRCNGEGYVIK